MSYVEQESSHGIQAGQWIQNIESGRIVQISQAGSYNYSKNA